MHIPGRHTVVALLIGGVLLGVVGAVVATPIAASILLIAREVLIRAWTGPEPDGRRSRGMRDCRSTDGAYLASKPRVGGLVRLLAESVMLSVERSMPGVAVIRVAGEWNRVGAARVGTLVETQLARSHAHPGARIEQVIVDLGEVARFDDPGLQALAELERRTAAAGVRLCIAGWAERATLLPEAVTAALANLTTAPIPEPGGQSGRPRGAGR